MSMAINGADSDRATLQPQADRDAVITGLQLRNRIEALPIDERSWRFLIARVGFDDTKTLLEVARPSGLTRERVRQLQVEAIQAIEARLHTLVPALDVLEAASLSERVMVERSDIQTTMVRAKRSLCAEGWTAVDDDAIRRLLVCVRALVFGRRSAPMRRWPKLTFDVCALTPALKRHPDVRAELVRWHSEERDRTRTWPYKELAITVLREAKTSLHWREIADRAERLGHRRNFSASSIRNAIGASPDLFARIDSGTYGLVEWGLQTVEDYDDIIARILHGTGHALSFGEIYQGVDTARPIMKESLQMFLDMNPRFYRSLDGQYGLRSWLPPRSKQSLRTPRLLVEDKQSFQRVERAVRRGYDVERIVDRDRRV